jgi:hypothetical protein
LDSFGNQEIKPDGYVTFAETKYTNLVLSPKAKFEFTCEPHFDAVYMYPKRPRNPIDIYKTQKIGPPAFRYFNTAELIKIMRFNDVSFFNLTFYLKYKNKFEDPLEPVFLANFIFSTKEHFNLQDAFEQGFDIIRPIGHRGMEKRLGGVSNFLYDKAKSSRNSEE